MEGGVVTKLFALREVAAHLGLTVNGVRSHLHRHPGLFQARYRFNSEPPRRLRVLNAEEVRTLERLVALAGPWRRQRFWGELLGRLWGPPRGRGRTPPGKRV